MSPQMHFKGLVEEFGGISLVEEFGVSWMREAMKYKYSKDPKVAVAGIKVYTGRKWSAKKELRKAEE